MSLFYKPLFSRVLIKREVESKKGSIIIPDNIAKRHSSCIGVVVDKGETASDNVSIGDQVIFGKNAGAWLDSTYGTKGENDDGTLYICQDEDILAIVK